ncbi:MAG: hypothetical protein B6245_17875 [Desulfobacteraceae bacterium 4572_88]|nr:MAG: hypothetical protein B6245_17875 [Desulfobacteraceae bacterium 4572_88]
MRDASPFYAALYDVEPKREPGNEMNLYLSLIIVGTVAVGLSAYLPFQILNKYISFVLTILSTAFSLLLTFALTKRWLDKEHDKQVRSLKERYKNKIRGLKKEHDTTTLEKTIRDGTQTLIKNALDYFKLENIKNEMGDSAAIQNLQLDKYGQIIELLADFSLILPDADENQEIVLQEIKHQIEIYQIDEKSFALFLQRIMGKYVVTVKKKRREKASQSTLGLTKICPKCAERVQLKAYVCKHCGYEFRSLPADTSAQSIMAQDHLEKGTRFYNGGNYQEAITAFSRAIEIKSDYAIAYYNRAIVYHKLGDTLHAENDLREASRMGHKKAQEFLNLRGMDMGRIRIRPPKYKI